MSRTIGTQVTVTAQKRRETFRIEVDVSGTDAVPVYVLNGYAYYITRDSSGAEVGRQDGFATVTVADAQIGQTLRSGIASLVAKLDSIALPGEP